VSSLFGLVAPAGQTAYAASKFAVRGFSEALRQELAGEVGVTTVHPGGIRTRIAESARIGSGVDLTEFDRERAVWAALLSIPPERAAGLILDAVEHRKARVLIGVSAKAPDLLARLLPVTSGRVYAAGQKGIRALALRQAARQAR
jgi:short-subunit dehydrogenase